MLRIFTYDDCVLLPCAGCAPADLIICLPSEYVRQPDCPPGTGQVTVTPAQQTVLWHFIEAQLLSIVKIPGPGGSYIYRYTIQYDDAQLNDGFENLNCKSIGGIFCESCLTQWVKDLVGLPVTITETDGVISLTNQYGCIFTFDVSNPPITPVDTETVDITVSGTNNHTIQADVNISPAGDNTLTTDGNGLYVPPPAIPAQFISSINIPAGCETVSAGSMVRQFSVVAGVLTVSSAPEHTTVGNGGAVFDGAVLETTLLSVGYTNTSACRSIQGIITHIWGYNYIQTATLDRPTVEVNVNGGGYIATDDIASISTGTPTDALNGKAVAVGMTNFTLAPSGVLVETRRQRVVPPADGSTHTPQNWGTSLIIHGSTV